MEELTGHAHCTRIESFLQLGSAFPGFVLSEKLGDCIPLRHRTQAPPARSAVDRTVEVDIAALVSAVPLCRKKSTTKQLGRDRVL